MYNSIFNLLLAIKKNIDNPSKDLKEPVVPSVVVAELKTPEDLPQVKIDKSLETEKAVSILSIILKKKDL
jgi:hypothetical protein